MTYFPFWFETKILLILKYKENAQKGANAITVHEYVSL